MNGELIRRAGLLLPPGRSGWLGSETTDLAVSMGQTGWDLAGLPRYPVVAGFLSGGVGERVKDRERYAALFLPGVAPIVLYGLLFTVVVLFALQGETLTSEPFTVATIAPPLLAHFVITSFGGFAVRRAQHLIYPRTATLAFPRRAPTSSWRSPSPAACSGLTAAKPWSASSAPSGAGPGLLAPTRLTWPLAAAAVSRA